MLEKVRKSHLKPGKHSLHAFCLDFSAGDLGCVSGRHLGVSCFPSPQASSVFRIQDGGGDATPAG